ncbi:MAG: sigma-70 family RNA polymerase sigma factor [Bryobacterales bacterium]|nr:sigma-70 family RNA polymerase sigma factor [Bryobacterales bacterium]
MSIQPGALAHTLSEIHGGNQAALDNMSERMYKELKRMAAAQLRRESPGHTLQPTALVHELYMRLADWGGPVDDKSRAHFMALAATIMRQILVHHARRRKAAKRGGGAQKVTLHEAAVSADGAPEVAALDEALTELAKTEERKARVIELRYFGGLTDVEIGEVLGISVATVGRDIRLGLALLNRSMRQGG